MPSPPRLAIPKLKTTNANAQKMTTPKVPKRRDVVSTFPGLKASMSQGFWSPRSQRFRVASLQSFRVSSLPIARFLSTQPCIDLNMFGVLCHPRRAMRPGGPFFPTCPFCNTPNFPCEEWSIYTGVYARFNWTRRQERAYESGVPLPPNARQQVDNRGRVLPRRMRLPRARVHARHLCD